MSKAVLPTPPSGHDERLLVSLAILQVNWERQGRSHFDNFVPFAVESMRRSGQRDYSDAEVRDAIREHFGIQLSLAVVSPVLTRVKDEGYGFRTGPGRFQLNTEEAEEVSLLEQEQQYARSLRFLCESLAEHAKDAFGLEWTPDQAEAALFEYVEKNSAALLGTALSGAEIPTAVAELGATQVVVASWIEKVNASDPVRFDYLLTVIKGSMLATGLFLTPGARVDQKFVNTALVLDTPFLLRALGYEGDEARDAGRDTLTLARDQSARLLCFERTVSEMRRVLNSAALHVGRAHSESTRAVDVHFAAEGYTRSQVEGFAERLEISMRYLGIEVVEPPGHVDRFTVDEVALERMLEDYVHYNERRDALLHDLELLTAVYRLRGSSPGDRLENCRAAMVTTNRNLVRVSRDFADFDGHAWPLGITDDNLATLLWVKQPMSAPDLPKHQLLAHCYTLLAPSNRMWTDYLSQIERLRNADELTDDQVTLLRYKQEAQRALVRETLGRTGDIDPSVIRAVLDRTEHELRAPANNQMLLALEAAADAERLYDVQQSALEAARDREAQHAAEATGRLAVESEARQQAQEDAHASRSKDRVRVRENRDRADRWASRVRKTLTGLLVLIVIAGVVWNDSTVGKVATVVIAIGAIIGNLLKPGEWLGHKVGDLLFARRLKLLHLTHDEAAALLLETADSAPTG